MAVNAQGGERTGQAVTQGLTAGDVKFTFSYPDNWTVTQLEQMAGRGTALTLTEPNELGLQSPSALLTLSLVDAERAINIFDAKEAFPYPVASYDADPEPFVLNDRDSAVASGTITLDGHATLILTYQVEDGIFLVAQAVSISADLESQRDAIYGVAQSVVAKLPEIVPTSTNTQPAVATQTVQPCPQKAVIQLKELHIVDAEEAKGPRDFGVDGDQAVMTVELGPILKEGVVNPGTHNEFRFVWTANLFAGDTRDMSDISYKREICDANFGLVIYFDEDDSTPFSTVMTPLGERAFLPLVQDFKDVEYPSQIVQGFKGKSQDGTYDYELTFSVTFEELVGITVEDLTPTATPSNTATATDTLEPTITLTPSNTFTPTPSDTPTNTYTPTITPTPSDTLTPSITPTPSMTLTPSKTPTPSNTPTPSDTPTFTSTPTPTFTPTKTYTPTSTYTPSLTFTPSKTPTITKTPLPSLTPTAVVCPGTLPSRILVGTQARVVPGDNGNRIRSEPNGGATLVGRIPPGEIFDVLDGPFCAGSYAWYQVEYQGVIGWTPEADSEEYWLEPLDKGLAVGDTTCKIVADTGVNQRTGPGTSFKVLGTLPIGEEIEVIGRFRRPSGALWWKLIDNSWVREDGIHTRGICTDIPIVNQ